MRRMRSITMLLASTLLMTMSCSAEEPQATQPSAPVTSGETRTLIAYFSVQGHTRAVAEAIRHETGADIYSIEPAVPYAANPYNDSDKIQDEAYNDRRPAVRNLLSDEQIAKYDTIFVGTPCWWHQPAMVVCTFPEHYDLGGKVVIPFVTYGARTYLNETMQKLYKCTPNSIHIPAELPEDLEPDNIRQPQNDDDGIDMPTADGVRQWLDRIGYGHGNSNIALTTDDAGRYDNAIYSISGMRLASVPESGLYISGGRKYIAR